MERYCDLNEISDGKLYKAEDWVKAGSNGCKGCSKCCQIVGESIVLDPFDVYELTSHMGVTIQELLAKKLELHVVDGLIMPNIKMENKKGGCGFLSAEGRCTIHSFRPGFCRMFPFGRYYENDSFHYILQVDQCPYPDKTKVQIGQWIGIPELKTYEQYICDWHYFLLSLQKKIKAGVEDALLKQMNMYILQLFYFLPYDANIDFYSQFYSRLSKAKKEMHY